MKHEHARPVEELLEHQTWLRILAGTLLRSPQDAEDLVQDAWVATLQRGGAPGLEPRAWLSTVLRRRSAGTWRARANRAARERSAARDEALPSASELAARADRGRRLAELVLELPPDPQRVLLLRYYEGLSAAEIARRLGRPGATVRGQLARGLTLLRQRIDAEDDERAEEWLAGLALPLGLAPPSGSGSLASAGTLVLAQGVTGWVILAAVLTLAVVLWSNSGSGASTPAEASLTPPTVAARDDATTEPGIAPARPETAEARRAAAPTGSVAASPETANVAGLRGRVLDPRTGEPVPWVRVGLVGDPVAQARSRGNASDLGPRARMSGVALPDSLVVRADADGRFEVDVPLPAGDLQVVYEEEWERIELDLPLFLLGAFGPPVPDLADLTHEPSDATPHELELSTGPVFRLHGTQWNEPDIGRLVGVLTAGGALPAREAVPVPVQHEPAPFLRFAPLEGTSARRAVTHLHVISVDGAWMGSAPVTVPGDGRVQDVSLELHQTATLQLELDADQPPLPLAFEARAWTGADASTLVFEDNRRSVGPAGVRTVALGPLPTGPVTVEVRTSEFATWRKTLTLAPGEARETARLERTVASSSEISGFVTAPLTWTPPGTVHAWASRLDAQPADVRRLPLHFQLDADTQAREASFRFGSLPAGRYRVWLQVPSSGAAGAAAPIVLPAQHVVAADGPPLQFEIGPPATTASLELQVVGPGLQPVGAVRAAVGYGPRGPKPDPVTGTEGHLVLELAFGAGPGRLLVQAEGFACAVLPLTDPPPEGTLRVELELGWGVPVAVYDAQEGAPLAGAELIVDGVSAGRTDADGLLVLRRPERPERLEVRLDGFELLRASGPIDPDGRLHGDPGSPLEEMYAFGLRAP